MPTRDSVAKAVRLRKERRPDDYCPVPDCLWFTGGGMCPRHQPQRNVAATAGRLARPYKNDGNSDYLG